MFERRIGAVRFLAASVLLSVGVLFAAKSAAIDASQSHPSASSQTIFGFWYDPWQPGTLAKLGPANVIIGAPPSAVSEIRNTGARALQYVTYYQSTLQHPFLKDLPDLAKVGFQVNGQFEKSAFGGKDNYVLCPNSVELRSRVMSYVDATLQQGFGGYFVDNTFGDPAAHQVCSAAHPHVKQGVIGGRAFLDLLQAVRDKLNQKDPGALIIANVGNPNWAAQLAPGAPSLWDLSDFLLWESYGYSSIRGPDHDRWKRTIDESFTYAAQPDKAAKILVLSYPENLAEARFSFAIARIFGFRFTANLGDSQQNGKENGGTFGSFLSGIPFDLGEPLGQLPNKSDVLLHRSFQNGEVFANTGTVPVTVSIAKGSTTYLADRAVTPSGLTKLDLQPMTAAIVLKKP